MWHIIGEIGLGNGGSIFWPLAEHWSDHALNKTFWIDKGVDRVFLKNVKKNQCFLNHCNEDGFANHVYVHLQGR